MSRFAHVLRRADARLRAPEPARSRILLELAQDLDDLYRLYRERGLSEAEAVRRAEELLGASDEAVDRLGQVHGTTYDRLLDRLPGLGRHPLERSLLTVLSVAALAAGIGGLGSSGLESGPSPYVWGLLPVAAASLWMATARTLELTVRAGGGTARPRQRLTVLLGLATCGVLVGLLGAALELSGGLSVAAEGSTSWLPLVARIGRAADVVAVSLVLSLATFLVWFHLDRRAFRIEAARTEALRIASVDI